MDLEVSLKQKQILSAKMIQSAEILQMNTQELDSFIKEQSMENPLIELEENMPGEDEREAELRKKLEWLDRSDEQNRIYYKQDEEEQNDIMNLAAEDDVNLGEFVMAQLLPSIRSPRQAEIISYMADSLDDNGYLENAVEDIRRKFNLSVPEFESYIALLQTADPAGVGARNLKECLLIQVDRMETDLPVVRKIINQYLEELGQNQLPMIAGKLGISIGNLMDNIEIIRSLNPRPGCGFCSRQNLRYILPDVTVVKFQDFFEVMVNDNSYPKVIISEYYSHMLNQDSTQELQDYISDKLKQAQWIIQCIEQRGQTLLQVSRCIVEMQKEFFEKGNTYLRPLRQQDVAQALGIHESTVSRAVRDKYIQCSWGVYPLNYFFSKAVHTQEDKPEKTVDSVKKMIQEIIRREDKRTPLSDQKITNMLLEQDIKISRRTVTKYRLAMGIRDTVGRREYQ